MKRSTPFNAKNREKAKKTPDYYTPKKAFDQIMGHYPAEAHVDLFGSEAERSADRARISLYSVLNPYHRIKVAE